MNKCAIVGCGKIAGEYDTPSSKMIRTHAKAFQQHPNCQLVGVCDTNQIQADNFAKVWDVPFSSINMEQLLDICKPDILSICSPTNTHLKIFEYACSNGVPIIWLEKPASYSLQEVEQMVALAEEFKTKVWVNYYRRYDAGFKKIKHMMSNLGSIQHVQAFYTKGLFHNGSHLIDLIHWFFGKINDIKVENVIQDNSYPVLSGILNTDKASIYLKALDYKQFELFELDIIGNNGRIKILDGGQQIIFEDIVKSKYYPGYYNLNIQDLHDSSYSQVMLAGLEQGLSGEKMPDLENEIEIQKSIHKANLQ